MKKILLLTLLALCMPVITNANVASYGFAANETEKNEKDATAPKDEMPTDDDLEYMKYELLNQAYRYIDILVESQEDLRMMDPYFEYIDLYEKLMVYNSILQGLISDIEYASTMEELNRCKQELDFLVPKIEQLQKEIEALSIIVAATKEGVVMTFKIISVEYKIVVVGDYKNTAIPQNTKGSITIPEEVGDYRVTYIAESAFENCSSITSVTIPSSVTSIPDRAFYGCSSLTSVAIGNGVTDIGNDAFNNCNGLTSVNIPNSVTRIGSRAFSGCSGLTSVTIGNGVTRIGFGAFQDCTSLQKVVVPDIAAWYNISFSTTNYFTFNNYTSNPLYYAHHIYSDEDSEITELTIPNSVTSIGAAAFNGCSGLTSITIPSSVTSIGGGAFTDCSGLTSVHISDLEAWCKIANYSNPLFYAHHLFLNGVEIKDLVIPNSVTSIGEAAFNGCNGLTSVTIPNSVTSIGSNAFNNCSGLTSVHISDLETWCKIANHSNPLSYAHHLFLNGVEVKDLVIPNSVTSIGSYAFEGCSGLTSIIIPNSVTSIGNGAFEGCSGLTSIIIPNSVTGINNITFWGCSGLTSVTIPNSVTSIGDNAFYGCSSITSIVIPNSVTSIGYDAFEDCSGLTDVYCLAESIPKAMGAFNSSPINSATLYVPESAIGLYRANDPWRHFGTIIGLTQDMIDCIREIKNESITPTLSKGEGDWFSLDGKKLGKSQTGINIIRYPDGTTRKVLVK